MTEPLFVRIRNREGKYLAGGGESALFCDDIGRAVVFDCRREQVEEQLAFLRLAKGIVLQTEAVDPKELKETCDQCGQMALAFKMYFDGRQYLCESCRADA